jgi:hypothetical protein
VIYRLFAVPEAIDADEIHCRTVLGDGFDREVRFDRRGDTVDLFHERARLQQPE